MRVRFLLISFLIATCRWNRSACLITASTEVLGSGSGIRKVKHHIVRVILHRQPLQAALGDHRKSKRMRAPRVLPSYWHHADRTIVRVILHSCNLSHHFKDPRSSSDDRRENCLGRKATTCLPLVRIDDESTKTIADLSEYDAKLAPPIKWERQFRWHALLDPDLPPIWSCVSMVPHQQDGPEICRDDFSVMFCTEHSGTHLPDRCLFFCSCSQYKNGGKNVLGKLNFWNTKYTHIFFKHRSCAQCNNPLARETLKVA